MAVVFVLRECAGVDIMLPDRYIHVLLLHPLHETFY